MPIKKHETLVKEAKAGLKKINLEISIINSSYNKLIRIARKRNDNLVIFGDNNDSIIAQLQRDKKSDLWGTKMIKDAWQATLDCLTDNKLDRKWGKDEQK